MKNLVTGGAGFIGSHIIEKILLSGEDVICIDDLSSGNFLNLEKLDENPRFTFIKEDVENYIDLKEFLKKEGYTFSSQTDSELIAHMLEYYLNKGNSMLDSMYLTKEKMEGAYAIAAIDKEDDTNVMIARSKSPLLIGVGIDEFLAASDPLAIGQLTNEFIFLEDGDVAELSSESYTIYDAEKKEVQREVTPVSYTHLTLPTKA